MSPPAALVELSRALGDPAFDLAILAEGNASASGGAAPGAFWVKASGLSMGAIGPDGFVEVRAAGLIEALDAPHLSDAEVRRVLETARVDPERTAMPSVETFMHAWLLGLPGVEWVGHTHPTALLGLLCRPDASALALRRLFPDEVVCCGPAACFVPYRDPGLPLAQELRARVEAWFAARGEPPKTIWLASHGLIALGRTPAEVLAASRMSEKAARVWLATLKPDDPNFLSVADVERIRKRPDEHYRQRILREPDAG